MDEIIKKLERRYDQILKLPEAAFFVGTVEYLEFLESVSSLQPIIKKIEEAASLPSIIARIALEEMDKVVEGDSKKRLEKYKKILEGISQVSRDFNTGIERAWVDLSYLRAVMRTPELLKESNPAETSTIEQDNFELEQILTSRRIKESVKSSLGDGNSVNNAKRVVFIHKEYLHYITQLHNYIINCLEDDQFLKEAESTDVDQAIEWSNEFEWINSTDFKFGGYGKVRFKQSNRLILFRELTEAKGNWVKVRKMAEKINSTDNIVRATLSGIKERLEGATGRRLTIVSRQEENSNNQQAQGAYRIKLRTNLNSDLLITPIRS